MAVDSVILQMINKHQAYDLTSKTFVIRQVIQEVVLASLARTDFFDHAAFYGGTCLRIFYGLRRYSEDMDFTLLSKEENFKFIDYLKNCEADLNGLGLKVEIKEKIKVVPSNIQTSYAVGNKKELIISCYPEENFGKLIQFQEKIRIKIEIDTVPPMYANLELNQGILPYPFIVTTYDLPSLFAGKIAAIIQRPWKYRVKGRDLYDYIFFLGKGINVNAKHLIARLNLPEDTSIETVKEILANRFNEIDYELAKQDVLQFIDNPKEVEVYSSKFFINTIKDIIIE